MTMSDKPLEDRLDEVKYDEKAQNFDGVLQYNLPDPKDLTNYYPPSASPSVNKIEKAVVNNQGEMPTSVFFDADDETLDFYSSMGVDLSSEVVQNTANSHWEARQTTDQEIEMLAKNRTKWKTKFYNFAANFLGVGAGGNVIYRDGKEEKFWKGIDFDKEFNKNKDAVEQEQLGEAYSMWKTEADSTAILEHEVLPNEVKLGMIGKARNWLIEDFPTGFKLGLALGDNRFHDKEVEITPEMYRQSGPLTFLGMAAKGLSSVLTDAVNNTVAGTPWESKLSTEAMNKSLKEDKIIEIEKNVWGTERKFLAGLQNISWEDLQTSEPELYETLMRLYQGDEQRAKVGLQIILESNNVEYAEARSGFAEQINNWKDEQIARISSGEDTVGSIIVDGLGAYSKYFVGSIASHAWLLSDEEYRKMAVEFNFEGMQDMVREIDYKPSVIFGIDGTFTGSMFDLANSFAFDPTVWLLTPQTGVRAGAIKMWASEKYLRGFMSSGVGKAFADDLYQIIKSGDKLKQNQLLKGFSDHNRRTLKKIVSDDALKGANEVTSETFYEAYTQALLKGDQPYNFHRSAWMNFKAKSDSYIINQFSKNPGKYRKAFRKLLTSKNTSTRVNLAGPRSNQNMIDYVEQLVASGNLGKNRVNKWLTYMDDELDNLWNLIKGKGTDINGSVIAANRLAVMNAAENLKTFEAILGFKPRNLVRNLGDDVTESGQSLRNLALDEAPEMGPSLSSELSNQENLNLVTKNAEKRLKTLTDPEEIAFTEAYIRSLKSKRKELRPITGRKDGQAANYNMFEFPVNARTADFVSAKNKEFMIKLIDDLKKLADRKGAPVETLEMADKQKKFADGIYERFSEILDVNPAAGGTVEDMNKVVRKIHQSLQIKLDKLMREYRKSLGASVRADKQRILTEVVKGIIVDSKWHTFDKFKGGWFKLVDKDGSLYSQAVKIEEAGPIVGRDLLKKDKQAVVDAHGTDVHWIDNPIQIEKTKAGKVKNIEIDWATLRVMMDFKEELGAASAVLRGRQKIGIKNVYGAKGQKFSLSERGNSFEIAGRTYDDSIMNQLKKGLKTGDVEEVEQFANIARNVKRTTNQLVEGQVPLSPLEFMIIDGSVRGNKLHKAWLNAQSQNWYQFSDWFHRTWAYEKIFRPSTAFVAAADEYLFYKSIYGWKGTIQDSMFHRDTRKLLRNIEKVGGTENLSAHPKLQEKLNKWVEKSFIDQQQLPMELAQRHQMGIDSSKPITLLSSTDSGFFQQATQHIEGLLQDYGFQVYAQVINKTEGLVKSGKLTKKAAAEILEKGSDDFVKWFDSPDANYIKGMKLFGYRQGKTQATVLYPGSKRPAVPIDHTLVNAEEAWKYYKSLETWYTLGAKGADKPGIWRSFIDAAAKRASGSEDMLKALPDAKYLGKIKVPGVKGDAGWLGKNETFRRFTGKESTVMEQMFGDPAWARTNMIANKAFATRKAQLTALFESQGKAIKKAENLTKDLSFVGEAIDPRFASDMWGMSYFDDQLFNQGYVTENYINALSMDFALQEVDDMMLKFHLSSPLQKELKVFAPFGGPWADFWGRYLKDLTRRSQFRGNWWAFTDEKTAGNFIKRKLFDGLNHLPNMRRFSYMSRIANAQLEGSIRNPLNVFGIGEERTSIDFSPLTFLPNGDNAMFVVNPVGGFIPIALIGTAINIFDDDELFELQETLEDVFPSVGFFPPEERWKAEKVRTARDYLLGGGVVSSTLKSLRVVGEAFDMTASPRTIDDIPTALKTGRGENNAAFDDTPLILEAEKDWDNLSDYNRYKNTFARAARVDSARDLAITGSGRLLYPVKVGASADYVDIADNWIEWAQSVGVYEDIVPNTENNPLRSEIEKHPFNEELKVEAMKDLKIWWFNLGSTIDGRAKRLRLIKEDPRIISLFIPGYVVTELGAQLLPEKENNKAYIAGEIFGTGKKDNTSVYSDYMSEGLIQVRLPDSKYNQIINEHARLDIDSVAVIYEKMGSIADKFNLEQAKLAAGLQDITFAEMKGNRDLLELYGVKLTSTDVTNLEDSPENLKWNMFSVEDLGDEVVFLLDDLLKGSGYENPVDGVYRGFQIIPYLYAASKAAKLNPAYFYSGGNMDTDKQKIFEGLNILTQLAKAKVLHTDEEGPDRIQFLTEFEQKFKSFLTAVDETQGQLANNDEANALGDELFQSFIILNHLLGSIYDEGDKNVASGKQWWDYYVSPTIKMLDLEWKAPLPSEGEMKDASFEVYDLDGNYTAEFDTISSKKPANSRVVKHSKAIDGDSVQLIDGEELRVIGIMAYETNLDPNIYPYESEMAIRQKAFLNQFLERYEGRVYYVNDRRFGTSHKDFDGRHLGWLWVDQGLDGSMAPGYGEYVFFERHFNPTDQYYGLGKGPGLELEIETEDLSRWDLRRFYDKLDIDIGDE